MLYNSTSIIFDSRRAFRSLVIAAKMMRYFIDQNDFNVLDIIHFSQIRYDAVADPLWPAEVETFEFTGLFILKIITTMVQWM